MTTESSVQSLRVLVTGATGKLGQLLVPRLLARGVAVRALTRQPEHARRVLGPAVEIAAGDLGQPATLDAALRGVTHLFLLSPIDPLLAVHQGNAIAAAERAGVQRIVKLSGSAWTTTPPGRSLSGDLHAAVERQLAQSGIAHLVLQPNAWAQVALGRLAEPLQQGDALTDPFAGARVAYIDARDIADVAVAALLETAVQPPEDGGPWVLTGPEPLDFADLAAAAGAALGRTVAVQAPGPASQAPAALPAFTAQVHAQFRQLIAAGAARETTSTVERVLGRPARSVRDHVAEQARQALAGTPAAVAA